MTNINKGIFQLIVLMLTHFVADMMGGVVAGVLPILKEEFALTIKFSVIFMATISISSNLFQIYIGTLRKKTTKPFFLYAGLIMLMLLGLLGILPQSTHKSIFIIFAIFFGFGVAAVHPEGLRGALGIESISEANSTSAFMMMGFLGFSTGPLIGALLVSDMSLKALALLIIPLIILIFLIKKADIKLVTDKTKPRTDTKKVAITPDNSWSFNQLFTIAVLLSIGATFIQALLPTYIFNRGFSLTYGGVMAFLFGLGSSFGSLAVSYLAKRYRPSSIIINNISVGIPLLLISIWTLSYGFAGVLLFLAGFFISSSLPLLVVLAKMAPAKHSIGVKMGIMVGGAWGIAAVILLLLSGAIDYFGIEKAMKLVVLFYIFALAFAYFTKKKEIYSYEYNR